MTSHNMDPASSPEDPPELCDEHMLNLITQIEDWQINHGSLLKAQTEHSIQARPVGVSVFPTAFPRANFRRALHLQEIYNELYCAIADDEEWIFSVIKDLIPVEPLAGVLWGIYEEVKKAGFVQDVSMGIFRSDYMLHCHSTDPSDPQHSIFETTLKQVEFNAFSCAGGTHAHKVVEMHRYLSKTGAYNPGKDDVPSNRAIDMSALPPNHNIESLASGLAMAHATYGPPKSKQARQSGVLFIVQPNNFNIADERPIEYALWNREVPVPAYRLDFGEDVLSYTWLTESRELLFHPPWLGSASPVEISVVYMRAGYEIHEYDRTGWKARAQLEKSAAIKCPSILSHLSTFKKVQQALTVPGTLERFLSDEKAAALRETFVSIYPLDNSVAGYHAQRLATDPAQAANFILKPSLEGGGHNIFGTAISDFMSSIPRSKWSTYILMERIESPYVMNVLMGPAGIDVGEVVSELGVLGTCLWRRSGMCNRSNELLHNSVAGWSFKTKHADIDEMSVVKGYGCFDTPRLMDP